MKVFKALFVSFLAALLTAFAAAILIMLTNFYLGTRGIVWQNRSFDFGFISMTYLDTVLLVVVILVFCLVLLFLTRKDRFGKTPLD